MQCSKRWLTRAAGIFWIACASITARPWTISAQRLAMTRQAVSKHLGLLEEANLVATVKRGREKLHYLNPVPIHEIGERWIGKFERGRLQALSDMKQALELSDE